MFKKSSFEYQNYAEMSQKSEAFKKGVKDFKEGNIKNPSKKYRWYKGLVSSRDWENYFSKISDYCLIGEVGGTKDSKGKTRGGKRIIAFIAVKNEYDSKIFDIRPLTDEEARMVDEYRRGANIYPRPLTEIK